mmetsp:Transcript_30320/g.97590  ORF Transcript_30320/g.97590 Transcript_30320/m.97590 type:complete len:86 (-) Transcript_30320:655-912(-)
MVMLSLKPTTSLLTYKNNKQFTTSHKTAARAQGQEAKLSMESEPSKSIQQEQWHHFFVIKHILIEDQSRQRLCLRQLLGEKFGIC